MGLMSLPPIPTFGRSAFRRAKDSTWTRLQGCNEVVDPFGDYLPLPAFQSVQTEPANLPVLWTEKLPVVWVEQRNRQFRIERCPATPSKDVAGVDERPWYVEETTWGDDRDDFGRADTHAGAMELISIMMRGMRYAPN